MYDRELNARLIALGMDAPQASRVAYAIRTHILPASVIASKALNVVRENPGLLAGSIGATGDECLAGCGCSGAGMGALGLNMQSTGTTVSYVATGAKIGSVIPGIGTAIGAVVGGVYAALKHILGNHDVRVSGADRAQCQNVITQYISAGGGTIGAAMTKDQFEQLNWCLFSIYGGPTNNVDYRYFQVHMQWAADAATQIVKAAMSGAKSVTFTALKGCPQDGRACFTFTPKAAAFPNPVTVPALAAILNSVRAQGCACCGNIHPQACPALFTQPGMVEWANDYILFVLARDYPQAAQSAAPTVTATPAVVQTAAQIASAAVAAPPAVTTPAALMSAQLADSGVNMTSPAAQALVSQVAAEGVQPTPTAMTAGIGYAGLALMALVFFGSKKHGH